MSDNATNLALTLIGREISIERRAPLHGSVTVTGIVSNYWTAFLWLDFRSENAFSVETAALTISLCGLSSLEVGAEINPIGFPRELTQTA
jgi:hypothetical protein